MDIDIRHRKVDSGGDALWFAAIAAAVVTFWVLAICAAIMHDRTVRVVIEFQTPPVAVMPHDGGAEK